MTLTQIPIIEEEIVSLLEGSPFGYAGDEGGEDRSVTPWTQSPPSRHELLAIRDQISRAKKTNKRKARAGTATKKKAATRIARTTASKTRAGKAKKARTRKTQIKKKGGTTRVRIARSGSKRKAARTQKKTTKRKTTGRSARSGASKKSPPTIDIVREAVATMPESGRFGAKVFISSIWRRIGRRIGMTLPAFKKFLIEQNRMRNLTLARADLVDAMNRRLVDESEINDLGAQFHFVVDPARKF